MSDDWTLDLQEESSKKRKKSSGSRRSSKATSTLKASQIEKVTGRKSSKRAGQYLRKTITLPPEQVDYIDEIRHKEGVGVLAFYRWLIDQGLQNYERGARPLPQDRVLHDIKMGHWSSE